MIDLFELISSDRFLAGGQVEVEKSIEFPPKRPWVRRVTCVGEYLDAVTKDPSNENLRTPWHFLNEDYLDNLKGLIDKIGTLGRGSRVEEYRKRRSELSNRMCQDQGVRHLGIAIAEVAGIDGERLVGQSLAEAPYGHLSACLGAVWYLPEVEFPLVTVLLDAYQEGLIPYGVFTGRLDKTYAGPDVLMCLNPGNLYLSDKRHQYSDRIRAMDALQE